MTQTQDETRTRTFAWTDPLMHASMVGKQSGLDLLQAMARGDYPPPPILELIGYESFEIEEGRAVLRVPAGEYHYNPLGSVHGGIIATMLDTACGCTVHSTLPAGVGYTSLDLSTRFLKPATIASGLLTAEGSIVSRGRRIAVAEARLTDERGTLLAHATSTCMLFELNGSGR
jgi:uncharacterized protein (TIGR00369 family)